MNHAGNRNLRIVRWSVVCLVVWHGAASQPARAQQRVGAKSPPETPSQRWLPLPEGSGDLREQVRWLQQLQGLLGADGLSGESPPPPKFNPEQLKVLLDAMKQMGGGGPDGTQPSGLDGISREQVAKAMADPALREQARQVLEQFTREGKLPQGDNANSNGVPFPSTSTGRGSESSTGRDSPQLPPATLERLKRLVEQAGRQPPGVSPERDPFTDGLPEREPGGDNSNSPRPDGQRRKSGDPKTTGGLPTTNNAVPNIAVPNNAVPLGEQRSPTESPRGESPSVAETMRNGPMTGSTVRGPVPPGESVSRDSRSGRPDSRSIDPRDSKSAGPPSSPRPSVNDPSSGDSTNGSRSGYGLPAQPAGPTANRDRAGRSAAPPPAPFNPGPAPSDSSSGPKRPPIDVRSELAEQGFAQTLQKIIEQSREESQIASLDGSTSSTGGSSFGSVSLEDLKGTADRMRDGLRKEDGANRPKPSVPSPALQRTPPAMAPALVRQPVPEQRSPLSQVSKAAGNLLSEIATPPAPRPAPAPVSREKKSSGGTTDSQGGSSRSAVGLLMLLAVLGLVWYFAPKLLAAFHESHRAGSPIGGVHSIDIRSRSDVVRAFHHYALRPATPAPTWWTHRQVEQQVAETTPALQPAIQTLADLYEQARYLPDEADFTPDQIGTARRVLVQCEACPSGQPRKG